MTIKLHPSFAIHPGVWLKTEILEPHGLNVTVAAEKLGVTRQAMSNLLNGHAGLSAEMAIRFEKAFGVRADTMMRMQA
jgi:antitoxin HigA-1